VRMAIAHEWLSARAGSEKTFEAMAEAFPSADLFALTREPSVEWEMGGRSVKTTFLDRWAPLRERREFTLPLMPLAWSLSSTRDNYDIVLTSSHAFVRTFPPAREAVHFCYCHAPMRYAWDPEIDARTRSRPVLSPALALMRAWDRRTVATVNRFAANSTAVRERIARYYDRDADVIFPPVDTEFFAPSPDGRRQGVLAFSRFIPYKRLDLAIEAAARAGVPITVAGSGPAEADLRKFAARVGADAHFEIRPTDERLRDLYRSSLALIFPANEDFGIVPVEAQACGLPVIGIDQGGVRDTVIDGETGYRLRRPDVDLFAEAIRAVAQGPLDSVASRRNALRFSRERFIAEIRDWLAGAPNVESATG
jgi:glycosyltransferase involved in cell wall biosynthesis